MHVKIEYKTERDKAAAMIAEDVANDVKKVLVPLAEKIEQEGTEITLEFGSSPFNIKVGNASPELDEEIRKLLIAFEVSP